MNGRIITEKFLGIIYKGLVVNTYLIFKACLYDLHTFVKSSDVLG